MKVTINNLTRSLIISLIFAVNVFTSCSSDDSESPNPETPSNTLTANAGPDQTIEENNLVTLDGSASSDIEEQPFEYSWEIITEPSGSNATLDNSDTSSPSFTPNTAGMYTIELEISNADFESTDTVNITITDAGVVTEIMELGGNINEDIVLTNRINTPGVADYCVTSDIDLDAVMTIEPGVELHFDADLSFKVGNNGVLIAKGTAEDHIVFTAKNTSAPWRGVGFVLSDDFRNEMDYVDISYAGIDKISIVDRNAALGLSSFSTLSFTNSSITNSAEIGMFVDGDVDIRAFENNRFENNEKAPLVISIDQVHQMDTASQFGDTNGTNYVEVVGGTINNDEEVTWSAFDDGTPYHITDNITVSSVLNIMPGVELFFDADLSFQVGNNGVLIAKGTAVDRITFTAKNTSTPWRGVGFVLSDNFRNEMDYVDISYAGIDDLSNIDRRAALGISSFSALSFTNSSITNSAEVGMFVDGDVDIRAFENNRFEDNTETPLVISAEQVHQLDAASTFGLTNGNDYVEVLGAFLDTPEEITWNPFNDETPFFLSGNLDFQSNFGGLNIAPNVKIMIGSDLHIRVDSAFLSAKGASAESMVTFTAFDTTLPWQGISFLTDDIRNELDFVEVSYAGSDMLGNINITANVGIGAFDKLSITNSIISNGLGYGVSLDNTSEVNIDIETSNTITNNILGPVFFDM